jgi:DNA-binding transcriptional LysR family regulator
MYHDRTVMTEIFSKNGVSLERLQTLAKVVRAGSIALAAKGDPNAQSLISRQLGELEAALELELLERATKPYQTTPAARRLAECCERFVREVGDVSAEADGRSRPLKVGAGEWVIRELLIPLIGRRTKQWEGISWVMHNLTSSRIQEGLAAERLDVGLAPRLQADGRVRVKELPGYGMRLLLPAGETPDPSGWQRLARTPLVVLEGDGGFRRFLAECERERGVRLRIGAECTSYPQAVELAEAAGWAVFVPELGWKRRPDWAARQQKLPGLEAYRHTLHLGWNERVSQRRPEVAKLVKALGGLK